MSLTKPFLSIIVPCYNSRKYLPKLLQSVVDCNMQDIEVILADDCSEQTYQDIIDKFSDNLTILECKTDHNCGSPSNGREFGAQIATGQYLTFIDHDDALIPEGIKQVREFIESNDYPEYIVTGIQQVDLDGNVELEKYGILPFLHGKFFNVEKFYRKCDLHHKKDILYSEDNYFTALIACNLIKYELAPTFTDFCTYRWTSNPASLSRHLIAEKKENKELNLRIFNTNLSITYEVMFKFFDEGSLPYPVAAEWLIREVLSMYFDSQLYFNFFEDYKPKLAKLLADVKSKLDLTNEEIMDYAFADDGRMFRDELNNMLQFWPQDEWEVHLRIEQFLEILTEEAEQ